MRKHFIHEYRKQLFNVYIFFYSCLSIGILISIVSYIVSRGLLFYYLSFFEYSFLEKIRQSIVPHYLIKYNSTKSLLYLLILILIFSITHKIFIKKGIKNTSKFSHYIIKTGMITSFSIIITGVSLFFLFFVLIANQQRPVTVIGMESNVTEFSLGKYNTCAIQKGALKCWGNNKYGQLGIGTKKNSSTPQIVKGLKSDVTAVSLESNYACAIQKGALKCWGNNKYGQLGIGTKKNSSTPQIVKGLKSDVTAVSLESNYACAIQKGALKCWGNILDTLTNKLKSINHVEFISIHKLNICISEKNILKCSGYNQYGQLGNGTKEPLLQFKNVKGIEKGKKKFEISDRHSCNLQQGVLKCWGDNKYGQLGTTLWRRKIWSFSF